MDAECASPARATTFVRWAVAAAATAMFMPALVAFAEPAHAAQIDLYVSTQGSDVTGTGAFGAPWATIQKARDHIESNGLNDTMTADIVVHVMPGTYYQTEPIEFDESDSGSNGNQVVYKADGAPGSAHLVGGAPVTGWEPYSGGIVRSYVGTAADFHTLYENGVRARLARTPNYEPDAAFPSSQAPYLRSVGLKGSRTRVQYPAGSLDPSSWGDLSSASVYIWSSGDLDANDWYTDTVPITGYDPVANQLLLAQDTRYTTYNSRFFVQGVLPALDAPGEFYLDRAEGYLYYYPRSGAVEEQTIIAPAVRRVFSFEGSAPTSRVHDIVLDGLTIEMTDFTEWFRHAWVNHFDSGQGHTYGQYDRMINMPQHRTGMVFMQNTSNLVITNAHLKNSGYSAVFMLFANDNNTISNSWIEHAGHSGVYLEGPYPGEGDVLHSNQITNSVIHDVGELVGSASGVAVINSSRNTLSHLEIFNTPRYATLIAGFRASAIPKSAIYARDNLVSHVRVHHGAQDSGDTAPVYSWGLRSGSTPFVSNTYEQMTVSHVYAHPSMRDVRPDGIFMDNETHGQIFTNVKVWDVQQFQQRNNDSGNHTLTNVSWLPDSFSETAMDYASIGPDLASFPYPDAPITGRHQEPNAFDGFEQGLVNWASVKGTAGPVSTATVRSGKYSYAVNEGTDVIGQFFAEKLSKYLTIWFYDDASDTSLQALASADEGPEGMFRALGVSTPTSTTHYVTRVGGVGDYATTSVPRWTGWHELTWDYASGAGLKMYIDGVLVAEVSGATGFDQITLGDWWSNSNSGAVYFDDITLADGPALISDDFESGLDNWMSVPGKGTPSVSTAQAHSGSQSYIVNEGMDVVEHRFPGTQGRRYVSLWFYDNSADVTMQTLASVDSGPVGNFRGIGVNTPTSTTHYATRIGSSYAATSVPRSTGWHQLVWDHTSGTGLTMMIDGVAVADLPGVTEFDRISLGDWWDNGYYGTVYFDDLEVLNVVPGVDGFETGLRHWTPYPGKGTASLSTAQAHSGLYSYPVNEETDVIVQYSSALESEKVVTVWFYDDATDTSLNVLGSVDEGAANAGDFRGIGVVSATSTTHYATRIGGTANYAATAVARSTGWHEFTWDYSSGSEVKLYIDGTLVAAVPGVAGFDRIALGDWWTGGTSGSVFFDDIKVSRSHVTATNSQ